MDKYKHNKSMIRKIPGLHKRKDTLEIIAFGVPKNLKGWDRSTKMFLDFQYTLDGKRYNIFRLSFEGVGKDEIKIEKVSAYRYYIKTNKSVNRRWGKFKLENVIIRWIEEEQ